MSAPPCRSPYHFLLDEDLSHRVADTAHGLGVDVVSVHEIGRLRSFDPAARTDHACAPQVGGTSLRAETGL